MAMPSFVKLARAGPRFFLIFPAVGKMGKGRNQEGKGQQPIRFRKYAFIHMPYRSK